MALDAFLADLDDLESGDEDEDDVAAADMLDEGARDADAADSGDGGDGGRPHAAAGATGLLESARLSKLLERIDGSSCGVATTTSTAGAAGSSSTGVMTGISADDDATIDEAEYDLIVACNEMVIDVEYEIDAIAKTVRDAYARRFPELDSLIPNPLDYARVVLKLGNEIEMSEVDLTGLLPSATIMVVTVTASTTVGTVLPEEELRRVVGSCEQVLQLSEAKTRMLAFVESRMAAVAPNLSRLVGAAIAAKLIGAAGGLHKLASLPSTVVQILGSKKRGAAGSMGAGAGIIHGGFLQHCDLVTSTPPALRNKVLRLVAGKGTLAARVDTFADKGGGSVGQGFREEIETRATKLQEPPPRAPKPLPVPPEAAGKRRGGRRMRKMKERYGMSQMRQLTNRVTFGEEEDTTADGVGLGVLGRAQQAGKLRVSAKEAKLLNEKNKKARLGGGTGPSGGGTSGLASSLAFTPVQGIELVNPSAAPQDSREGTETYFQKSAAIFKASV